MSVSSDDQQKRSAATKKSPGLTGSAREWVAGQRQYRFGSEGSPVKYGGKLHEGLKADMYCGELYPQLVKAAYTGNGANEPKGEVLMKDH